MLYPIIALTYVWTTLLSYTVLGEPSNAYKNLGIVTIVIGVAVMGRGARSEPLARSMVMVFGASVIGSFGMAFLKMGAHLDSWDQGTGAVDDGTGMRSSPRRRPSSAMPRSGRGARCVSCCSAPRR